jgi:hypothetical protein
MPYYYDNITAEKKGPFRHREIKDLVANGTIQPDTIIELVDGKTVKTEDIPELKQIIEEHTKNTVPPPSPPNFDSSLHFDPAHKAVAPSSQTTPPSMPDVLASAKKFLVPTVEEGITGERLNRQTYILLAIFLGGFGIHDFYAKRYKPALAHLGLAAPLIFIIVAVCLCLLFPELMLDVANPAEMARGGFPVSGKVLLLLRISCPLFIISNIWALRDIPIVRNDGNGLPMKE